MKFCKSCNKLVPTITSKFIEEGKEYVIDNCLECGEIEIDNPAQCLFCEVDINPDEQLCDDCQEILDRIISRTILAIEEEIHNEEIRSYSLARSLLEERFM